MSARPVLKLHKAASAGEVLPSQVPAEPVPHDGTLCYVNWRASSMRPTRRYVSADAALAEARRIAAEDPGAIVYTYELRVIGSDGEGLAERCRTCGGTGLDDDARCEFCEGVGQGRAESQTQERPGG